MARDKRSLKVAVYRAHTLFYGLAGIRHVVQHDRNALENTAMVSDMFLFAVLLAYVIADIMPRPR